MYQEEKIMLWLYIHIIFRVQLKCVAMSKQIIPWLHYNKTQATKFHSTNQFLLPCNQVYCWNFTNWNNVLGYNSLQKKTICWTILPQTIHHVYSLGLHFLITSARLFHEQRMEYLYGIFPWPVIAKGIPLSMVPYWKVASCLLK